MSQKFRDLVKALDVAPDRFIRTTDKGHQQRAQLVWKALAKDIYKNKYVGWYCTGDEEFFTETVVKENNGVCPDHNSFRRSETLSRRAEHNSGQPAD